MPQQKLFQAACLQRWPWLASTLAWSHCGHHLWHHYLGNWQALCSDRNRANSTCTLELTVPLPQSSDEGAPSEVSRSCVQSPWTPFPGRDLQLRINAYPVGNRRMTTSHLSAYVEVLPPEKHSDWHVALDFTFVMKAPGVSGRHCSWASGPVRFTSPSYGIGRLDWGCHELLPLPQGKNWSGEISLKAHVSVQDAVVEVVFANRSHLHADDFGLGPFRTFRARRGGFSQVGHPQRLRAAHQLQNGFFAAGPQQKHQQQQQQQQHQQGQHHHQHQHGQHQNPPRAESSSGDPDEMQQQQQVLRLSLPASTSKAELLKAIESAQGVPISRLWRFARTLDVGGRLACSLPQTPRHLLVEAATPGYYDEDDEEEDTSSGIFAMLTKWSLGESTGTSRQNFFRLFAETADVNERSLPSLRYAGRRTSGSIDTTVPSASVGTAADNDDMDLEMEGETPDFPIHDVEAAEVGGPDCIGNSSSNNNNNNSSRSSSSNSSSNNDNRSNSNSSIVKMDVDEVGEDFVVTSNSSISTAAASAATPDWSGDKNRHDEDSDLDDEETAAWNQVRVFVKTFHHGDSLHFARAVDAPRSEDAGKLLRSILSALQMAPAERQHYAMAWEGCPSDWAEAPPGCAEGRAQIPFDPSQEIVNGHGVVLQGDVLVLCPRNRLKELAQLYHFQYRQRVKAFQRLASAEMAQAGRCTFASLCEVMDSLNVDAWRLEQLLLLPQTDGNPQVGAGMAPQRPLLALMQTLPGLHPQFFCDSCGTRDLRGDRYNCSVCSDFDLCEACYKAQPEALVTRDPAGRCHQRCHRMTRTRPALPADCLS